MSENNSGSNVAFFLAGAGIGAILALLFAPKSGKETRDYLTQKAGESREKVAAKSQEYRRQAEGYVDKAKEVVNKQKEQLSAALEAGKQAYREEKSKAS
ncbi:MAG: YtxH domain-containing protein [Acidobacteria bacterium]|nr:YtxH domain-containing protein [Acidobacteriota bacterium]